MLDGIVGHHLAAMQDDHARADALDGFEFMGAEEDHLAAAGEFLHQAAQDQRGGNVEAGERLVEQEQIGIVQQRPGEQDFLAHAFRISRDGRVAVGVEREQAQQAVNAFRRALLGQGRAVGPPWSGIPGR